MKKIFLWILLVLPLNVFAYSNNLLISGEPIGIEIHSNGVYIIDFYKVNKELLGKKDGLQIGDKIIEINNNKITSIHELNDIITKEGEYKVKVQRGNYVLDKKIIVEKEENTLKTGLYLKDEIDGIGTLSYIDPETKIYASLGHEIQEEKTNQLFEMDHGYLFDVEVNYINPSKNNVIGEIHANFNNTLLATIEKNEENGIYGFYQEELPNLEEVEVKSSKDVQLGKASLYFQLENEEQKEYEINILDINDKELVKNIYFEITDQELLEKTGGIIQGMSGSPILQDGKIIGVVNYVVMNDSKKGYGIFIEKMLEEGDKLLDQ